MAGKRFWLVPSMLFALAAGNVAAAADPARPAMSARVDQLLAEHWAHVGVKPAPLATDAEFLRRVHLDLTGIIPNVGEVRDFLADIRPDKRARLIESLLARPNHAAHFANVWRAIMLPSDANVQQFGGSGGLESWLQGKFVENTPYDKLVTELLTSSGNAGQPGPTLFFTSLQNKPEELAASTSRIFLGVQISCAQCHDHPFDHWKKEDFWGYAAFFARLTKPVQGQAFVNQVADADTGEVSLPGSSEPVVPRFLGGETAPSEMAANGRRTALAQWFTGKQNPYFARATVNRVWAHLFGRGLVDPVDDLGRHNQPSHPELLDELARYFVDSGYDLRLLIRTLTNTEAYQLSSEMPISGDTPPELFARMAIKSLNAEQIYDCLKEAMRQREAVNPQAQFGQFGRAFDQNRQLFLSRFEAPTQGATEFQAGIPQALTLMNGQMMAQATDLGQSDLLNALDAPFFSDSERVEILFMSTLSRAPAEPERAQFMRYVETGGPAKDRKKALGDVLWALLNSAEFILNH